MNSTSDAARAAATLAAVLCAAFCLHISAYGAEPVDVAPRINYKMKWGHGWSVCESYLKALNARRAGEGPPLCSLNLDRLPGASEPKWEVLDIAAHLPLVHQVELLLGRSNIEPEPERDFEQWKAQREQRIKDKGQTPRLRRARVPLAADGPVETFLSYDLDVTGCAKAAGSLHRPDGGFIGADVHPNFLLYDEVRKQPRKPTLGTTYQDMLFLYRGRPHYVAQFVSQIGDGVSPGKLDSVAGIVGSLFVGRLEPIAPSPEDSRSDWPPYRSHELCEIRFDAPISLVRKHQ